MPMLRHLTALLLASTTCLAWSINIWDYGPSYMGVSRRASSSSYLGSLSANQRAIFEYGMKVLDNNYRAPFLFNSPRYTAWYSVGLLARNEGDDAANAAGMIERVISYQFTDPKDLWFGDYKETPYFPDPSAVFPPQAYGSYDLNVGLFICTSWIIALEEFSHLLDDSLVDLMQRSMYNATVGDGYRVGGVDGDNLYPVYSNPWYMRVMAATYVGHLSGDTNMSYYGEQWARQAVYEFGQHDTLSEFNSGTYTGVTLYALSLWGYMPANSTIAKHAPDIITKTWISVGQMYNPTLKSLGGPFDRSYGFDMKDYFGILGGQITGLIGGLEDNTAPIPIPLYSGAHLGDVAAIALFPLTSKFTDPHVPASVLSNLKFLNSSGHSHFEQAASPPYDSRSNPRNYTSFTGPGVSVGGMQIDNFVVGGSSMGPGSQNTAIVMWDAGETLGWFTLYSTSPQISAIATATNLSVSYPPSLAFAGNMSMPVSHAMTFLLSGFNHVTLPQDFLANGSAELPGLRLSASGNVVDRGKRSFVFGEGTLDDLGYYNLTYDFSGVDGGLEGVPSVVWEFEKVDA